MRDHDRARAPSPFRRLVAALLLGRFDRRIEALQAEIERLADRVDELERRVEHQDGQLKRLINLLPHAMTRHIVDTDASSTPLLDRRKMH